LRLFATITPQSIHPRASQSLQGHPVAPPSYASCATGAPLAWKLNPWFGLYGWLWSNSNKSTPLPSFVKRIKNQRRQEVLPLSPLLLLHLQPRSHHHGHLFSHEWSPRCKSPLPSMHSNKNKEKKRSRDVEEKEEEKEVGYGGDAINPY